MDEGVPVIRGQNMGGRLVAGDFVFVTPAKADSLAANLARPGDIVFTQRGTLGQVSIVPEVPYPRYLVSQSQMKLSLDRRIADPLYFYYLFSGNEQQKYIQQSTIQTGVPHINLGILRNIPVARPPLPEQRAIAGALSDVDALIGALDKLIAKKRDIKQAAMQQLLTGKQRLPGFEANTGYKLTEVGVIPEDWRIEPVGQVSIVGRGRVISHKEIARSRYPRYPVYSSQTSNDGVMGYLDSFDFEGEYITWTTDGAKAGTVFHRNGRFNCTNVCGTIKLTGDNVVFVAKVLGKIAPRHVSRQLGNPKLMNDVMKRVKIPLPPTKAEQDAIATVLSDMDAEISALERKREKTRALKQGMMQELLTGRTRLV